MPYSALQAARLTRCTRSQLAYWERTGLVVPVERGYTFRDLVALRVVASLLEAGLSIHRVRQAIEYLLDSGEDVAGLRLITDGDRVWACHDDGQILDALKGGQLALFVAVDAFAAEVTTEVGALAAERDEFVARLEASSAADGLGAP